VKARKKPVEVEVIRFDKTKSEATYPDGSKVYAMVTNKPLSPMQDPRFVIETLEGDMIVSDGDYIIKGVHGEFYPCKPDIFEKTYDTLN
jgi:hypothetical protein